MTDLTPIRQQLEAELANVFSRHAKIDAHLHNADRTMPQDWEERAQFLENDEVLEALEGNARGRIEELRAALQRIEAGSYGSCLSCGAAINPRRLQALPTTPVCVRCASN